MWWIMVIIIHSNKNSIKHTNCWHINLLFEYKIKFGNFESNYSLDKNNKKLKVKLIYHKLLITFENNEKKIKDMKPYLEKGVFSKLKNKDFFNKVKIAYGTICWNDEIDLCADSIYETSYNYENNN